MVHGFAELHGDLLQGIGFGFDVFDILAFENPAQVGDSALNRGLVFVGHLVTMVAQRLLGGVDHGIGLVARVDQLAALLVLSGMLLRLVHHAVDVVIRKTARGLDTNLLLLASALVLGRDIDNAVGVNVEGDFDLRHTAWRWGNADQVKLAEQLVVGRDLALALKDADGDRALVVLGG